MAGRRSYIDVLAKPFLNSDLKNSRFNFYDFTAKANYRINDNKLEGENKAVFDQLTLGERIDSPDALKLPLQLAIRLTLRYKRI